MVDVNAAVFALAASQGLVVLFFSFLFSLLSFRILLTLVCAESLSEHTLFFFCFNLFIFLLCTFQQS